MLISATNAAGSVTDVRFTNTGAGYTAGDLPLTATFSTPATGSEGDYRFNETIIILGVYLLAIQRLVPIIQNFFHQFSALKFYRATFDSIYDDLRNSFL